MDRHKKHSSSHDKKPYSRDSDRDRSKETKSSDYKGKFKEPIKDKNKKNEDSPEEPKEKPNLALSGNLAKDTNLYNGVVIKYNEPSEARKPKKRWRLYVFKGEEELPFYQIHRQSAYLFGRERKIADIPVDHPSCSKQHAVFQYRSVHYTKDDGSVGRVIRPYVIDLGSTNGTYINNERIEAQRYYELKEKDVLKFGFSSREYILLHEESKADDNLDEDDSSADDEPVEMPKKDIKKEKDAPGEGEEEEEEYY